MENNTSFRKFISSLATPVLAVMLALMVGAIFIAMAEANPIEAYKAIIVGAFGNGGSFAEVLVKMTPLLITGLSMGLVFATGTIALGAEGQIIIGGIAAAAVGIYCGNLPSIVLIPLTMLAGCAAGAVWAFVPGVMYATRKTDIVVMTLMFNYIAIYVLNYLIAGPMMDPTGTFPRSSLMSENSNYPRFGNTRLHLGFLVGIILMLGLWFIINRTPIGVKIGLCGSNRVASRYSGMNVKRYIVFAVAAGGALAGLAGASEMGGLHHRLLSQFSSNYGWNAVAVALLGRKNPIGIGVAAFFWSVLIVGANSMQRIMQVPSSLVTVIQAVTIFFILASDLLKRKRFRFSPKRKGQEIS